MAINNLYGLDVLVIVDRINPQHWLGFINNTSFSNLKLLFKLSENII